MACICSEACHLKFVSMQLHAFDSSEIRTGRLCDRNIFIFMDVTDSGPDQAARKKKVTALVRNSSTNIIYVPAACLLHQYHLAVQDGLTFLNTFISKFFDANESGGFRNYFGALAAIANSWRDQASRVIDEWVRQYGYDKKARQYPSQVIQGRWGSVDTSEAFLLERGQDKIQSVLLRVLSKFVKAEKANISNEKGSEKQTLTPTPPPGISTASSSFELPVATTTDIDTLDDTAVYRLKLSKWYRTTWFALSSKIFWFTLRVAHQARQPLRHFFAFVQKYSSDQCIQRLVNHVGIFKAEIVRLVMEMPQWLQNALDASGCNSLNTSLQGKLKLMAVQLVFKQYRSFELRILKRLDE